MLIGSSDCAENFSLPCALLPRIVFVVVHQTSSGIDEICRSNFLQHNSSVLLRPVLNRTDRQVPQHLRRVCNLVTSAKVWPVAHKLAQEKSISPLARTLCIT